MEEGYAHYHLPRAWRRECRVFVDQAASGEIVCDEGTHLKYGSSRRLWVRGLVDATITIYPETGYQPDILANPSYPFLTGRRPEMHEEDEGRRILCRHVSGALCITW
jgi:hypothetical protein